MRPLLRVVGNPHRSGGRRLPDRQRVERVDCEDARPEKARTTCAVWQVLTTTAPIGFPQNRSLTPSRITTIDARYHAHDPGWHHWLPRHVCRARIPPTSSSHSLTSYYRDSQLTLSLCRCIVSFFSTPHEMTSDTMRSACFTRPGFPAIPGGFTMARHRSLTTRVSMLAFALLLTTPILVPSTAAAASLKPLVVQASEVSSTYGSG